MNFLLNILNNTHLNDAILSLNTFFISCLFSLIVMITFLISKKFINTELNKLKPNGNKFFDQLLILGFSLTLSFMLVMLCFAIAKILTKQFNIDAEFITQTSYSNIITLFALLLTATYSITTPKYAEFRIINLSNKSANAIYNSVIRMTAFALLILSIELAIETIITTDINRNINEYLCTMLIVCYFFLEIQLTSKIIKKCLHIDAGENYSMSEKLASFINNKINILIPLGTLSVVFTNYTTNDLRITFYDNLKEIICVIICILAIQIIISYIINVFFAKLRDINDGKHTKRTASSRQKNLIWICDIMVIFTYLFIICAILQYVGIDIKEYIFHDKLMVVSWVIFFTVVIYRSFHEFTDAILEKAELSESAYKMKLETFMPIVSVVFNVILFCTATLIALSNLGISITPILATFTVFSASIGLAAKDIIQSFLQGIILLFEKDIYVGEETVINGISGVIEQLTARVLHLRSWDGYVHVIPYHNINTITHCSKDYMICGSELCISSTQNVATATELLISVINDMKTEEQYKNDILSDVSIHGLKQFDTVGLKIIWSIKVMAIHKNQFIINEVYRRLNTLFKENSIEVPESSMVACSI